MHPMKRHVMLTEGSLPHCAQRLINESSARCFTEPALERSEGFNMTRHFVGFIAVATA
jgi:hypothetical protein